MLGDRTIIVYYVISKNPYLNLVFSAWYADTLAGRVRSKASHGTIAKRLSTSIDSVFRYTHVLMDEGILIKKPGSKNTYTISDKVSVV